MVFFAEETFGPRLCSEKGVILLFPALNEFMLIEKQHSCMLIWLNKRMLVFLQIGTAFAVQSQPRQFVSVYCLSVCAYLSKGYFVPAVPRGLSAPDVHFITSLLTLGVFPWLSPGWHVVHNTFS